MVLIVEGMDNCFKDTIIKNLRKELLRDAKTICIHSGVPPVDSEMWSKRHYTKILREVKRLSKDTWLVIMNRGVHGEAVYGPIYRKNESEYVFELEKEFLLDSVLVTLIDDADGIIDRDDGDSISIDRKSIEEVRNTFINVHGESKIKNKKLVDISTFYDKNHVYPEIRDWIKELI